MSKKNNAQYNGDKNAKAGKKYARIATILYCFGLLNAFSFDYSKDSGDHQITNLPKKVIEMIEEANNPEYFSKIGIIDLKTQELIDKKFKQLQEVLRNKNYAWDNSGSEERNIEIHNYIYSCFFLIIENYDSYTSVDIGHQSLEKILDAFIKSVEMNNGITIIYSDGTLKTDEEGMKELDELNAVGVAYPLNNKCIFLKRDNSNWKTDDFKERLEDPEFKWTCSTLIHELTHTRQMNIQLPDNIQNLGLGDTCNEKYLKCKSTLRKMFIEGMAVSYGNLAFKVNEQAYTGEIEEYIRDYEYAVFSSITSYPVFSTLFENFSRILGSEYIEKWMQGETSKYNSIIEYFEDEEPVNVSFEEMRKAIIDKYGTESGTKIFNSLFESMLDILLAYQEYTEKLNEINADFSGIVHKIYNQEGYTIDDAIKEIEISDTASKEEKEQAIKFLYEIETIDVANIQASSDAAIVFQKTMLESLYYDLQKALDNKDITQEEIIELFNTYKHYINNELIEIHGNISVYNEQIQNILRCFVNTKIEMFGYKFTGSDNVFDMIVINTLLDNYNQDALQINSDIISTKNLSFKDLSFDDIRNEMINNLKNRDYDSIDFNSMDYIYDEAVRRVYGNIEDIPYKYDIPEEIIPKVIAKQKEIVKDLIEELNNIAINDEQMEIICIQTEYRNEWYFNYNGELYSSYTLEKLPVPLKIAYMDYKMKCLEDAKSIEELKYIETMPNIEVGDSIMEEAVFYELYSIMEKEFNIALLNKYWQQITNSEGEYVIDAEKKGIATLQDYINYCENRTYDSYRNYGRYRDEAAKMEKEQRDIVIRKLQERSVKIAGYTFKTGNDIAKDREALASIMMWHRELEDDPKAQISAIDTNINYNNRGNIKIEYLYTKGEYKCGLICDGEWYRSINDLNDSKIKSKLNEFLTSKAKTDNIDLMISMCRVFIGTYLIEVETEDKVEDEYKDLRENLCTNFKKTYRGCSEDDFLNYYKTGKRPNIKRIDPPSMSQNEMGVK